MRDNWSNATCSHEMQHNYARCVNYATYSLQEDMLEENSKLGCVFVDFTMQYERLHIVVLIISENKWLEYYKKRMMQHRTHSHWRMEIRCPDTKVEAG